MQSSWLELRGQRNTDISNGMLCAPTTTPRSILKLVGRRRRFRPPNIWCRPVRLDPQLGGTGLPALNGPTALLRIRRGHLDRVLPRGHPPDGAALVRPTVEAEQKGLLRAFVDSLEPAVVTSVQARLAARAAPARVPPLRASPRPQWRALVAALASLTPSIMAAVEPLRRQQN